MPRPSGWEMRSHICPRWDEAASHPLEWWRQEPHNLNAVKAARGEGPVTAVAFIATVDDVTRFRGAHQLEAYLGLVPSEWSSSEVQRRGRITKAGNGRMRWLLVQAAWCILRRRKQSETAALREWADRIAGRRGRSIAVVALARRLAGILFAIWRDGTVYDASKVRRAVVATQVA